MKLRLMWVYSEFWKWYYWCDVGDDYGNDHDYDDDGLKIN